jgi:hypothetical protein
VLDAVSNSAEAPTKLKQYMQIKAKVASQRVRKLRGVFWAI